MLRTMTRHQRHPGRRPAARAGLVVLLAALAGAVTPARAADAAPGLAPPAAQPRRPAAAPPPSSEAAPPDGMGGLGALREAALPPRASSPEVKAALRAFVRSRSEEMRACYLERPAAGQAIQGTVTLRWQVAPDGTPSGVVVVPEQTTATDAPLLRCMRDRVSGWRFPRTEEAFPLVVTYPWSFRQEPRPRQGGAAPDQQPGPPGGPGR
jgi:hypothetical protein